MSSPYDHLEIPIPLVSVNTFHGILWTGFSLSLIAGGTRIYIRLRCFGKLLVDDWVMLFALTQLLCSAALGQVYLRDVYILMGVGAGVVIPDASFPTKAQGALRAFGIDVLLSYLGIWAIKMNCLLFFKRLGTREVRSYSIFWWVVLVFTIACGVVSIGLLRYHCLFGPINEIIIDCPQRGMVKQMYDNFKVTCIVDVLSDAFILTFPLYILWKTSISLKKKLMLSAIFSLVVFTMAITIIRSSIVGGVFRSIDEKKTIQLNITWIWFWFFIEFSVSFIIACLVSFRALFAQRERRADANEHRRREESFQKKEQGSGFRRKAKRIHDSILASFKDSETLHERELPIPESGRFSPAFLAAICVEDSTKESNSSPIASV